MSEYVLDELRERHPGWRLRALSESSWMATRRRCALTDDELAAGLACTLLTDSVDDLRAELSVQLRIESALKGPSGERAASVLGEAGATRSLRAASRGAASVLQEADLEGRASAWPGSGGEGAAAVGEGLVLGESGAGESVSGRWEGAAEEADR